MKNIQKKIENINANKLYVSMLKLNAMQFEKKIVKLPPNHKYTSQLAQFKSFCHLAHLTSNHLMKKMMII